MKHQWPKLAQQYEAALVKHVKLGRSRGLPLARAVGKQAAAAGLNVLDLARLHDRVLARFRRRFRRHGASDQIDAFFAQASTQLGQMGDSVPSVAARSKRLQKGTKELASSQQCFQSLTRRLLSAQENERATISRTLHDDVAQTMLGIRVKLAQIEKEASSSTTNLQKELTTAKEGVHKSAKTLARLADRLG